MKPDGTQISIVNVTVSESPALEKEQHWIWSVIGHPTIQTALTKPGDVPEIKWGPLIKNGDISNSITYQGKPFYSGAVMLMNVIIFSSSC